MIHFVFFVPLRDKIKMKKVKRFLVIIFILMTIFASYVQIINRNSINMTYRQKFLKAVYPAWIWWMNFKNINTKKLSNEKAIPLISFYALTNKLNDGATIDFSTFKGKKLLLVNTASDCGYTNQYTDLEKLYQRYKEKLTVIAFPANDFNKQEKGDDTTIAEFCKKNYMISFPIMKKSSVVKGPVQNPVFKWLTDPTLNGWNDQQPVWNFCKYLVDENGRLINYFGSSVEPFSKELINAINK